MRLAEIVPAAYNPRVTLTEKDFEYQALRASIDEFGLVVPLIVNRQTGTLVSGHQRLNVMLAKVWRRRRLSSWTWNRRRKWLSASP